MEMILSKDIALKFLHFIDRRLKISEFEQWVYSCEKLNSELEIEDYLMLIEFDYNSADSYYKMDKILDELLNRYAILRSDVIKTNGILGRCISKKGRYQYFKEDNTFDVTEGNVYNILTIDIYQDSLVNKYVQYIIMDDNARVYYVPSSILNVNYCELPDDWIIEQDKGIISLEPKDFNTKFYKGENSFWEDFHDDVEEALIAFAKYLHKHNIEVPERFRIYAFKSLYQ
jgi:hypothetical protein